MIVLTRTSMVPGVLERWLPTGMASVAQGLPMGLKSEVSEVMYTVAKLKDRVLRVAAAACK